MKELLINGRTIGPGRPCYIVGELSANHGGSFEQAANSVRAIKEAGADAVKVQTYTADSLTLNSNEEWFKIRGGTLWDGRTLYELYQEASMPWEWQPKLQKIAAEVGLDFFSTPFDATAVDFLEKMNVPAHKVASFELVDLPLLKKIAATGKPIVASTGMATEGEIGEALQTMRLAGASQIALLKCTSSYPAGPEEMNLRTIPDMAARFDVPVGLSDHSLDNAVAIAAVALGACVVEKHFTLARSLGGPDAAFSLEPAEFAAMVKAIRVTEAALGVVQYRPGKSEEKGRQFRRSLFIAKDVKAGELFTAENLRAVRPANGAHTRHYEEALGRRAAKDLKAGTPFSLDHLAPQ